MTIDDLITRVERLTICMDEVLVVHLPQNASVEFANQIVDVFNEKGIERVVVLAGDVTLTAVKAEE